VTGNFPLGNLLEGIYLEGGSNNLVGGIYGNLISGNRTRGIFLVNASWNSIQGNLIGTKADGISDLGQRYHAIELEVGANNNTIGGVSGGGNRIAHSQGVYSGVRVREGSLNNRILRNLIFGNGGLGIDLGVVGVTPNDACDADTGANNLQNYPSLTLAGSGGSETAIGGVLASGANDTYVVQFFANASLDPSGHGEGESFLGETTVTTSNGCSASFYVRLPFGVPAGYFITATATDSSGNTSEFSPGIMVIPEPTLTITQPAEQMIRIAWPQDFSAYRLEQTASLNDPIQWTEVTGVPFIVTNGYVTASIGATNGLRFYRLRLP